MTDTQGNEMDRTGLLAAAMAESCREAIQAAKKGNLQLPRPLHAVHLLWMCDQIERHVEDWPPTRLHRWIGFVQCGLMANGILDLKGIKRMFNKAKVAFGKDAEDLIDHLNSQNTFDLEIGGEG